MLDESSTQWSQPHFQLIGTLIAAIDYGVISCIFLHTIVPLISNKRHSYTRTMRKILITYIAVMFALSTASIIQTIMYVTESIFATWAITPSSNLIKRNEPLFLPLTILGADGFMVWRIVIFNQNASCWYKIPLYSVLFLISLGSFGSAILYYLAPRISVFASSPVTPTIITISITTSLNFILTVMVIGKLLNHHGVMRRILGKQYRSPYWKLIVVLVESCSLIVVTGIVFLVLAARGDMNNFNSAIIPLLLLPHVCVASPLLIVYQVARGRAITCSVSIQLSEPMEFDHSTISTIVFSGDSPVIIEELQNDDELPQEAHVHESLPISPV
ncbi:hypothetical protein BDN70DRAFT_921953 [Pholiota conissans]|uniref:Uncharacterized protein n=1 Tax=Pholiota conissans TaxID=109636 RepID=A0A9P5Z234_9AGAR|nr:hypothetical protein BDN70DRAFT_921953 [Pholiota conissans]